MTEPYKIIEVKESVFADNDREAARLRTQLKQDRTFLLNLMSSPGSGKTTTLLRTLEALKDEPLIELDKIGLKGSPTNIFKSFTPPQKGVGVMLEGADRNTAETLANILLEKHVI